MHCNCVEHTKHGTPDSYPDHTYSLEQRDSDGWWRWTCSCGGHGRYQGQSPSVAYHAWEQHVVKAFS